MFLSYNDIYSSSGALKLYHCWTDKVTKFDSSSFYNWEQDDLPVYDLEERTFYLWEQLGYPTSSIPGVALVVSGDAPASATQCNKNVFTTLSGAIEALPQVINYPIIIEVASFGNLGELNLHNYKFGPRGSLEIINRNHATAISQLIGTDPTCSGIPDGRSTYSQYQLLSGVSGYGTSIIGATNLGPRKQFIDSSCLSISCAVFSSTSDSRLTSATLNGVAKFPISSRISRSTLVTTDTNTVSPYDSNASTLAFSPYEYNARASDEITTKDVSCYDTFTDVELYYSEVLGTGGVNGMFYGNTLNKISVVNCDGPLYIRGFMVDGSGISRTNNQYGVEVLNSTKVYIESLVSVRNRKAGIYANNSDVVLTRGCVASRNYDFTVDNQRLITPWASRVKSIPFNTVSSFTQDDDSAGLLAVNSTITVSSTSAIEFSSIRSKINSDLGLPASSTAVTAIPNLYTTFEFSRNSNGIVLQNSILQGGAAEDKLQSGSTNAGTINLSVELNTGYGLKTQNSKVSWDGRLYSHSNLHGVLADNSNLEVDKLLVSFNQIKGINLINSVMKYNKNRVKPSTGDIKAQFHFSGNGQHIELINSKLQPFATSSMPSTYGRMYFRQAHGLVTKLNDATLIGMIPAVSLKNNSEATFIHPDTERDTDHGFNGQASKGSEFSVTQGSTAVFQGSVSSASKFFGPSTRTLQAKTAGIYAGNNSIVEFNGPTVIGQFGIDVLAENNSVMTFGPHKDRANGSLDISSFNLENPRNHTVVELHSTRACLVADKNSIINMQDLGSYRQCWARSTLGASAIVSGHDYPIQSAGSLLIEPYVSGGSIQFYPNPNDSSDYDAISSIGIDAVSSHAAEAFTYTILSTPYYLNNGIGDASKTNDFSAVTNGGVCVRAVNGSIVNVLNVNFPCGWWNPSSVIYDSSTVNVCDRTFIWNIADTSILKAAALSVSGLYPRDSGYFGPSGAWASGSVAASGLPSSTPDTSSQSILDYFGAYTQNPYGKTSQQNYGPFRLYFSVNPMVNVLTHSGVSSYGAINQIYAQGYQPSANLSAYAGTSALYPGILQRASNGTIYASGYYYGSAMVDNNGSTRAYLDESAAESFANAKHCAVGKSGMSKLTSIYYPFTTTPIGDSASNSVKRIGRGFKSTNIFDLERDD